MAARSSTNLHLNYASRRVIVDIRPGVSADHILNIGEEYGAEVAVFMTDAQLRQLLDAINARLGLISVGPEADARPDCICLHLAGDNERCELHSVSAEAP